VFARRTNALDWSPSSQKVLYGPGGEYGRRIGRLRQWLDALSLVQCSRELDAAGHGTALAVAVPRLGIAMANWVGGVYRRYLSVCAVAHLCRLGEQGKGVVLANYLNVDFAARCSPCGNR
jgi:hypothetical protein